MSRKDYVALAEAIRRQYDASTTDEALRAVRNVALMQAAVFAEDNPNFDRRRFLEAALGEAA